MDQPRLSLIGGFDLRLAGGARAVLPTRKSKLLLAYLALPAGVAHARETLASLFWGDRRDEQARGSLRNALAALRLALGPQALRGDGDTVELVKGCLDVDVDRLAAAGEGGEALLAALRAALRGELLEGLPSPSEAFGDWLAFERRRCRSLAQDAAQAEITRLRGLGDWPGAIDLAQRLVAFDPLRETSHRLLMGALAAAGERSRAMAQYQDFKELLRRELGIEPSPETIEFARSVAAPSGTAPGAPPAIARRAPSPTGAPSGFSVVVLPFEMGGTGSADIFLAEGFGEDLVTELSRSRDFSVIARQSSHRFSGRPDAAATAATELSARYALTGSLRRAGDRLRVTTQLIDAAGDRCIWAERYDRDLADIFAVQDEIVASILGHVDAEIRQEERARAARKPPRDLDAWELFHRGLWHVYRFTKAEVETGEAAFRAALALAPDLALAHAGLAYAAYVKAVWFFVPDPVPEVAAGVGHAGRALDHDDSSAFAHVVLGRLLTLTGAVDAALYHLDQGIALAPSFAQARFGRAQALLYAGRPGEAEHEIELAMRLSPKDPLFSMFLTLRSFCRFSLGDYADAVESARRAARLQSRETWSRLALAAALAMDGRSEEARRVVEEARQIEPGLSLSGFGRLIGHAPAEVRARIEAGLRLAGVA